MSKRWISAALAAVMLCTSLGASAARLRKTTKPLWYGSVYCDGFPENSGTGDTPKTAANAAVVACNASLAAHKGKTSKVSYKLGAWHPNGNTSGKFDIYSTEYTVDKKKIIEVLRPDLASANAYCKTTPFTSSDGLCHDELETAQECYDREIKPYKATYDARVADCKLQYNKQVEAFKIKIAEWRMNGALSTAGIVLIANEIFTAIGALPTAFGTVAKMSIGALIFVDKFVFAGKLAQHWTAYMNATDTGYNMTFLSQENACFGNAEKPYFAAKTFVTNDCK